SFACAVSIGLQHGVPLKLLCEKFAHTRFEPSGWSGNPDIGFAKSIMDYIFRWLQLRFLTGQQQALFDGLRPKYFGAPAVGAPEDATHDSGQKSFGDFVEKSPAASSGLSSRGEAEGSALSSQRVVHAADALKDLIDLGDAPTCSTCGAIMT